MPTETDVHGDALCFMVKTWARHKTTETVMNNGWRLVAVGGGRRLAVAAGGRRGPVCAPSAERETGARRRAGHGRPRATPPRFQSPGLFFRDNEKGL